MKRISQKIYFCDQETLIALYASNGNIVKEFGKNGKIKLKKKCQITTIIINDKIINITFFSTAKSMILKKVNFYGNFF